MIFNTGTGGSSWNSALNELGAKNLIPYPYYEKSHTDNGVAWTDNGNGTVTASGNATGNSGFTVADVVVQNYKLPKGKYILTGCPSGGSTSTYRMWANRIVNGSQVSFGSDFGEGLSFELTEETYVGVGCQVVKGTSVSGLTFKPMIRHASISDDTYEPYAMTNKQLTDNVEELDDKLTALSGSFQSGEATLVDGAYALTFPKAFSKPPIVIVTAINAGTAYGLTITVKNITESGCEFVGNTVRPSGVSTSNSKFNWLAIG